MKDNFSSQAAQYAKYRPVFPPELTSYIISLVQCHEHAWDCGTGNGQLAQLISPYFKKIFATDISAQQLENAVQIQNIIYSKQPAEKTLFEHDFFDLVTVGQAVHWFQFDAFFAEVDRVLKAGGILALAGYNLFSISAAIDPVISEFYRSSIGPYWDKERKYVDEAYKTIPFPFQEIEVPEFTIRLNWTFDQLTGYLKTWSAVKHFEKKNGFNPVDDILPTIKEQWGNAASAEVNFPVICRIGRK
ncbi:MAG: class I SAM-dependent methyltransferase [Ferruginibacter sp.]